MKYYRNCNCILRHIGARFFIIDITDNYSESNCSLFEVNSIGSFIWDCMETPIALENIIAKLKAALTDDVPVEILTEDVESFLSELQKKEFVLVK